MSDDEYWPLVPRFRGIPAAFHSLEHEGPFEHCLVCNGKLLHDECEYFVERIFRGTEPIVEYAMCLQCHGKMRAELSAESVKAIEAWLEGIDHEARMRRLFELRDAETIDPWLDHCMITGNPRADCSSYQIIGAFRGNSIAVGHLPCLISGEALKQMNGLLSKKTRDRMDDFTGENFGMPPEFCERPDFSPMLI